jgi:hypothetical protein
MTKIITRLNYGDDQETIGKDGVVATGRVHELL